MGPSDSEHDYDFLNLEDIEDFKQIYENASPYEIIDYETYYSMELISLGDEKFFRLLVYGDGNCFYWAISAFLSGIPSNYYQFKRIIFSYFKLQIEIGNYSGIVATDKIYENNEIKQININAIEFKKKNNKKKCMGRRYWNFFSI